MLWWTLRQLKSDDPATRERAVEKLAGTRGERAVEAVTAELRNQNAGVRRAAAAALGGMKSARAVEPLAEAVRDRDNSVVEAAARALGEIGGVGVVAPLVALLDKGEPVHRAAAEALTKINEPAFEALAAALENGPSCVMRERAAAVLKALGWQPENDRARACLAIAEGRWGDAARFGEAAVGPAVLAFEDDGQDFRQRESAAIALGKIGGARATAALKNGLHHSYREVRSAAVTGLAWMSGPEALDALAEALRNEHGDTRREAVRALGGFREPASDRLLLALKDINASVRKAAAEELLGLKWQPADDEQKALLEVARERWTAAAELGAAALEPLARALQSEDWLEERPAALDARGLAGKTRAGESPAEELRRKAPPTDVARAIARALGKVGHPDAVQPLLSVIRDIEGVATSEALSGLQSLLETRAPEIAAADLRDLANLDHARQVFYREVNVSENVRLTERSESAVDCSLIRQLARQELIRRGLEA